MAEIRKHNPEETGGIGDLVRQALGESIRPTTPGERRAPEEQESRPTQSDEDEPRADGLPHWPSDGPSITF